MKGLLLALVTIAAPASADQLTSVDCDAAERVVEQLRKTRYVVSYCSRCRDYAQVLFVNGVAVMPPGFDDGLCHVVIRGIPIARSISDIAPGDYSPAVEFLDLTDGPLLRPALWKEIDLAYVYAYSADAGEIVTLGAIGGLGADIPTPVLILPPELQERVVENLPAPEIDVGGEGDTLDCVGAARRTVESGRLAEFSWDYCWATVQRWVEGAILARLAETASEELLRSQAAWQQSFGAVCVDELAGSEGGSGYGRALGRCRLDATLARLNQLRGTEGAD
jgi:hypothetical protein